ncbi:hypothetical protein I4U23_003970 [Adineta vaga]|nr:hypothetical protein I4U23_003970 [Adineta vaga]
MHNIAFDVLENCLMKLIRLKSLTIEGFGRVDIIDAIRWEEYLRKTSIEKFRFRFTIQDLLEQFRSNFWFEEKHWYVAYSEDSFNDRHIIYSVPHFRPQSVSNVLFTYPPLSTVPMHLYNKIFFDRQLNSYFYYIPKSKSFNFCFTKTKSLAIYNGMCDSIHCRELIDTLTSCIDLKQVQKLDFSTFTSQQIDIIQLILTHTCHVQQLILTPLDSAFIFPEHIHSLYLRKTRKRPYERDIDESAYPIYHENIHELFQSLVNIRHLQVVIQSKELMSSIIDKFIQLKSVTFEFDKHVSSKDISTEWFQKNTQRLKKNNVDNPYRVENSSSSVQRYSNSLNVIPINNFTWHIRTSSELYREKRNIHVNFDYLIHYVCLSMSSFHKNE